MTDAEHLKEIQEEFRRKDALIEDYQRGHKIMDFDENMKWLDQTRKEEARRVD